MPVRRYKDTQNAAIFSIIVFSLIMAIISTAEYYNTNHSKLRESSKKTFTICYSISSVLIVLQILFNRKVPINNYAVSVPV